MHSVAIVEIMASKINVHMHNFIAGLSDTLVLFKNSQKITLLVQDKVTIDLGVSNSNLLLIQCYLSTR